MEPVAPVSGRSRPYSRRLMLWVQLAGLGATGWMIWLQSIIPRLRLQSWSTLAGEAFEYAILAGLASAGITLILYLAAARSCDLEIVRQAARTSGTAVWFAPATILLSIHSPAALTAPGFSVVTGHKACRVPLWVCSSL